MEHSVGRGREVGEVTRRLKSYRIPGKRAARRKSGGSFPFNIHVVQGLLCGEKVTPPAKSQC